MTDRVRVGTGTGDLAGCVVVTPTGRATAPALLDEGPRAMVLPVHGGFLVWDAPVPGPMPVAVIDDPEASADWTWWFWGPSVAVAVVEAAGRDPLARGTGHVEVDVDPRRPDRCRAASRLAHAAWLAAWWPASALDGIPPLDLTALAHEEAALRPLVDGLLDETAPPERPAVPSTGDRRPPADRSRFALAAGDAGPSAPGPPRGRRVAGGTCGTDWTAHPAGFVDASERAVDWEVLADDGRTLVHVEVAAGPLAPADDVALHAAFGDARVRLVRSVDRYGLTRWSGTAEIPAPTALPWPTPWIHLAGFSPPRDPRPGASSRELVRTVARARLGAAHDAVTGIPTTPEPDPPLWEAERMSATHDGDETW